MNNGMTEDQLIALIQKMQHEGMNSEDIKSTLKQMVGRDVEMSQRDGVTMVQNEGQVPGAYENAYSKMQDMYASSPAGQPLYNNGALRVPGQFVNMNSAVVPIKNPNARVEVEGQKTSVKPDGTVVIY